MIVEGDINTGKIDDVKHFEELTKMIKDVRCKTDSKYVRPLVILYKEKTKLIENLRKSEFKDSIQELKEYSE